MDLLLRVTPDEKASIFKLYDKTEEQLKEDIEIIKTWLTKLPHLPQDISDDFIGKVLMKNKFRVERSKQKLDNYFSLRGHNRDLIVGFETVVPSKHFIACVPLPNLGTHLERLVLIKLANTDPNAYDVSEIVKINLALAEFGLHHDNGNGVRIITDFEGFNLKHLMKWNPVLLARHVLLIEKAYSWRIFGLELLNLPEFASKILGLFQLFLPPKIYSRLRIHKSVESLHEVIPKNCLPSEYGGGCSTVRDLLVKWDDVFKNHRDFFLNNYNRVSDESLRPVEFQMSQEFGLDGTFKKLTVD